MKSIIYLATVCIFAFASAAVLPTNTDSNMLGMIKVPQVFLYKEIKALLKIYVINPHEKIQLPLDAAQLANSIYVEISDFSSVITANPQFSNTGLAPSSLFFNVASNVVVEIWDQQADTFVGGSVLTFEQAEQLPSQTLNLQDSTGTFAGVAQLTYEPPKN